MTSVIFLLFKNNLPNTHERNKRGGTPLTKTCNSPRKMNWIISFLFKLYNYFVLPMINMVNIISCMSVFVFEETIYVGILVRLLYLHNFNKYALN